MSLRSFHIFFILVSLGLMAFLAQWSRVHGQNGLLAFGAAGLLVGVPYLGWFIKKVH